MMWFNTLEGEIRYAKEKAQKVESGAQSFSYRYWLAPVPDSGASALSGLRCGGRDKYSAPGMRFGSPGKRSATGEREA